MAPGYNSPSRIVRTPSRFSSTSTSRRKLEQDAQFTECPFPKDSFGALLYNTRNRRTGLPRVDKGFPKSNEEAYDIQTTVEKRFGLAPRAWRLSHTVYSHRLVNEVSAPIVHPIFKTEVLGWERTRVQSSDHGQSVMFPELVFRLGKDLPIKIIAGLWFPYTANEVMSFIGGFGPGAAIERYHMGLTPQTRGVVRERSLIADSCGCRSLLMSHAMHTPPMLTSFTTEGVITVASRKHVRYTAEINQAMSNPLTAVTHLINEVQKRQYQQFKLTGRLDSYFDLPMDTYLSVAMTSPLPINYTTYTMTFDYFFRPADVIELQFQLINSAAVTAAAEASSARSSTPAAPSPPKKKPAPSSQKKPSAPKE